MTRESLLLILFLLQSFTQSVVSFQPLATFSPRRIATRHYSDTTEAADTGIETGVIRGIQEDEGEIDFGRCGVRLAQETAVRMSGEVYGNRGAQWKTLDNIRKVCYLDSVDSVKILASAVGVETYKDPGETTVKEVEYAPDEAAKAIVSSLSDSATAERLVINILGGDDLQVKEVLEAVEKISNQVKTKETVWNSISFKEFQPGQASIVVVATDKVAAVEGNEKGEDDEGDAIAQKKSKGIEYSLSMGEVYMKEGKYLTVSEEDVIEDFSEDWMV
jgi:hypothetical protein